MTKKSIPPSQNNPLGYFELEDKDSNFLIVTENNEDENEKEVEQLKDNSARSSSTPTVAQTPPPPPPTKQGEVEEEKHIKDETINDTTVNILDEKLERAKASESKNSTTKSKVDGNIEEDEKEKSALDDFSLLEQNLKSLQRKRIESKKDFLQESYKIFKKIHDARTASICTKQADSHRLTVFDEDNVPDINNLFRQYVELASSFVDTEKTEPLWDLAQCLYFSATTESSSNIATRLKDWYDEFYPMTDLENPENLEVFDICVHAKKRLLRGDLDQTSDLLQRIIEKVDEKKSTYIVKLIELIEQYETGLYEQNATEYLILWQQWHQNSQSYYQNYKSNFIKEVTYADKIDNEILSMYGILAGVEEHLREWSHESGRDWLNSIIGTILFTRPQILVSQLNSLAQDIGSYTKDNLATPEEQHFWPIYSSLIMGAFDDALDEMGDYFWLQTHLGHALIANGTYFAIAQPTDLAEQDQEKESPLLDPVYHSIHSYAMMLAQDFDMWNEAVTYISCCSLNKEYWTEQLLGNPPLPTKDSTYLESILETAEYYHLRNVVARINYELGRRCEKANNIHEATVRYALASDTPSLDRMARQLLDIYLERRTLQSIVTDEEYHGIKLDLKTKSNHYKALLDYNHFRGELAAKKWSDAAKSSALLIRNEYLPKQFKAVLMVDIMQILEDSQHHFTAKQMRQFIDLFHELTENSKTEALVAEYYQQTRNTQSVCKDIIARIRERISYKAATAPENLA